MRGIPILLVFVSVAALAIGGIFAQSPPRKEPPRVEFEDMGNGWLQLDQKGDDISFVVNRKTLTGIAYHGLESKYARTVYNDPGVYLVVIAFGSREYRLRCPTKKQAMELIQFIIGEENDGERQN